MRIRTTRSIRTAIIFGLSVWLWTANLYATELYSWIDDAGRLHITNIPALAPPPMRAPKVEAPQVSRATVIPPRPRLAPPQGRQTRADVQTRHLQKTVEQLEKRNESVKNLQQMLEKLLNP